MLTKKQLQTLKQNIANHRRYDVEKFGAEAETITYEEALEWIIEDMSSEQGLVCGWTGKPLTIGTGQLTDLSFDRLDNTRPHSPDNVIMCQRGINLMRNDATVEDFCCYLLQMGLLRKDNKQSYFGYLLEVTKEL